jgi:hypothetical protein
MASRAAQPRRARASKENESAAAAPPRAHKRAPGSAPGLEHSAAQPAKRKLPPSMLSGLRSKMPRLSRQSM